MSAYVIFTLLIAVAFYAGFRMGRAKRRLQPTPLQRALAEQMNERRKSVSATHDEAFFTGVTAGQTFHRN